MKLRVLHCSVQFMIDVKTISMNFDELAYSATVNQVTSLF